MNTLINERKIDKVMWQNKLKLTAMSIDLESESEGIVC